MTEQNFYYIDISETQRMTFTLREGAMVSFPSDPANRDYQEYLEWVEEGNVAEEWNPDAE